MPEEPNFVESLLNASALEKQGIDRDNEEKSKEKSKKNDAFKRLMSQIMTSIYEPLKEIVESYNRDSTNNSMYISAIEVDEDEEIFSFQYSVYPMTEEQEERTIQFEFQAKHTEIKESSHIIPVLSQHDKYLDMAGIFGGFQNSTRKKIEYKYGKSKILLWGVIKADCGIGINVAILENSNEPLYGDIKSFLRTPNIHGSNTWFPVEVESKLQELCANRFREDCHTTKVVDFDFSVIKELITQNMIYDFNSIKDSYENKILIRKPPF